MARPPLNQVLLAFKDVGGRSFAENFTPDCCLNATWIAIKVLKWYGVEAKPLSVRTVVMNPAYAEGVDKLGRMPSPQEEKELFAPEAFVLFMRETGNHPAFWPGHLVCTFRGQMLDASLAQFNRPRKGIEVPDMGLFDLPEGFLAEKCWAVYKAETGVRLMYRARLDDRSFGKEDGFTATEVNQIMLQDILAGMRRKLGR